MSRGYIILTKAKKWNVVWGYELSNITKHFFFITGLCTSCAASLQYQYISKPKPWAEAQDYCRKVHIDLAMVENKKNMTSLIKAVDPQYVGKVWIGLKRRAESRWLWPSWNSSQPINYTSWRFPEPDNVGGNICGFKNYDEWTDGDCSITCNFICFDGK